jgi:hypothetical protein
MTWADDSIRWKIPYARRMRGGWWDVHLGFGLGYLVIDLGRGKRSAFWSPNATPWHHSARLLFGRMWMDDCCVCDRCRPNPETGDTNDERTP